MWKVMIADDENYMLEAMENLIDWKKMDCQLIYKARNGQVLLEQIKINPPDIIITAYSFCRQKTTRFCEIDLTKLQFGNS